jgi:hypothetical protein
MITMKWLPLKKLPELKVALLTFLLSPQRKLFFQTTNGLSPLTMPSESGTSREVKLVP